jgi:prepilin-type N-terminal cleavage/methylation domain-containing protein
MSAPLRPQAERGFTLLELIIAMGIFLIICAVMFELLNLAQKKYRSETQVTASYQDARLALDQIVRDVNVSGFPAAGMFTVLPGNPSAYAVSPAAWTPGYPSSSCTLGSGGTCLTPSDNDLILETRLTGDTNVSWIWYHLDTISLTLYREVVAKTSGDAYSMVNSAGSATAFLKYVVNNPAQPLFQYTCDTSTGVAPCASAGVYNSPKNIRDVDVTIIVRTPQVDPQTQSLTLVELFGRGHRTNPAN